MEYGTANQKKSVFWNWIKQHDNILWMGLFLIVCACLVVGCSPSVKDLQESSSEESTTDVGANMVSDLVEESTDIMVDNAEHTTEEIPETETESPHLTYDRLSLPTYSDTTYPYYIEELDVTLDIPEGMHVYRTDSIRRHPNGSWFHLECCEWILVTDKEYEESYLSGDLLENLESEAKHLVFGLVLTEKELVPLARLYPSIVESNHVRVTKDWYCEILRNSTRMMTLNGGYGTLPAENCARWYDTALSARLEQQVHEKTLGTASLDNIGGYLLHTDFTAEDAYQNTMLDPYWWRGYCYAVEELTKYPQKYRYESEDVEMILTKVDDKASRASTYWRDGEEMLDRYVDQKEDIYLRAYYYANSYAYYQGDQKLTQPLEDIIIAFQDWNTSQRSFYVVWKNGGFSYGASDHMVDLQPSYQYLVNNDLLPVGNKEILSIPVGDGEGEVGYFVGRYEGPEFVLIGPEAFVVEGGKITVLDTENQRLLMFENGKYTGGFAVDDCESGGWLYHQGNQWIVVSNVNYLVGCIYKEDGTHVKNVPYTQVEPYMEERRRQDQKLPFWMEGDGNRLIDVLGIDETHVTVNGQSKLRHVYYYEQMDFVPDVPKILMKQYICKAQENGPVYYTVLDRAEWVYTPLNHVYLAEDGTAYLMECLEDRVVISEVLWEFVNTYSETMWSGWDE